MSKNSISIPTKFYLDTNHLICLGRLRRNIKLPDGQSRDSYRHLDEFIKNSYCGLIFNQTSPLEWVDGNATVDSANSIAEILDSAKLLYIAETDQFIYVHEILRECKRIESSVNIPEYNVLNVFVPNTTFKPAFSIIANCVPDYFDNIKLPTGFPEELPFASAKVFAMETYKWRQQKEKVFQERVVGFKESLSEDIDNSTAYFKNPDEYHRKWLKGFLKIDLILIAYNPSLKTEIDDLIYQINFDNCPATKLYFQIREIFIKNGNPPKDNDVDDWMYIPIIPYSDISIIEKKMKNIILHANPSYKNRIFHDVKTAVEEIENR